MLYHRQQNKSYPQWCLLAHFEATLDFSLKVALDGGTRPGDTLQILSLALAQPPTPRSITSHSVLRGHPSLTHRVGFFRGIHSQKIIIGTANFLKKICISDEKY